MSSKLLVSRRQAGFTLIELLVAMVVTGILLSIIMAFVVNTLATSTIDNERENLLAQAQTALDTANNDILQSADADTNNRYQDQNAPGAPSNLLSWQSTSTTLVLAAAATDAHGNVIFDDPLHYVSAKNNLIYFVQNGTLYRRTLASSIANNHATTSCPAAKVTSSCPADSILAQHVAGFTVTYYDDNGDATSVPTDARGIGLDLKLQEYKYNKTLTAEYSTRTVFRND